MGYPKYAEDNREQISERFATIKHTQERTVQREEYIPYHIRYQLPQPKVVRKKKRFYL